eukprot:3345472-Amphidinium_carterae.1
MRRAQTWGARTNANKMNELFLVQRRATDSKHFRTAWTKLVIISDEVLVKSVPLPIIFHSSMVVVVYVDNLW